MTGGGGIGFGQQAAQNMGGQPSAQANVQYSAPPASNPYQAAFNSNQQAPQQMRMSPFVQQQMMRQQAPQVSGLQAALIQMLGQYNQPMMRPQMQQSMQMPQYQNPALAYRPDIAGAQQNLGRVAKSVVLQQKEAAEAELARMQEAEAARMAAEQDQNYYSGG